MWPMPCPAGCWLHLAGKKTKKEKDVDRKLYFLAAVILAALALTAAGCGNKRIDNQAMEEEFEDAPEWVLTGHEKGAFSAVGSARVGKSGIQFAKTAAMAQARNELARQLSVRVHSLVNAVSRQTGLGEGRTADHMAGQVTRQGARPRFSMAPRSMGVSIAPGQMALMRMPRGA